MTGLYPKIEVTTATTSKAAEILMDLETRLSSAELLAAEHQDVEDLLQERIRLVAQACLQAHYTLRGLAQVRQAVVGADGTTRTHRRDGTARRLVTTVGEVEVSRTSHSGRDLTSLHPVDGELNLPLDVHSFGVRRRVSRLSVEMSFVRAAREFERSTGVHIAHRQVELLTRAAAVDMEAFYESGLASAVGGATGELLVLSLDQKGIVMRPDHLREATRRRAAVSSHKLESRRTKGEKPNRKRMSTVAAVYSIAPFERTPEEVVSGLKRLRAVPSSKARAPKPEHKRVWASLESTLGEVVVQMFDEAGRRDPNQTKTWLVIMDGDHKLARAVRAEARRRNVKVTLCLDFIHALEYLWRAGHALHAEGTPELEAWVLERLTKILHGKVSDVAAGMRRSATKRGLSAAARKPIDIAARYLLEHRAMMHYDKLLALGTPIASGVIEGTCRSLVNDRLDITGARWSLAGAEAVLKLRSIIRSGDEDAYWAFHFAREKERNHLARYHDRQLPVLDHVITRPRPRLRVVR
jgi:hypothetical protein